MKIMVDELPKRKDDKVKCIFALNNQYCMLEPIVYSNGEIYYGKCSCKNVGCEKLCCDKKEERK